MDKNFKRAAIIEKKRKKWLQQQKKHKLLPKIHENIQNFTIA